MIMLSEEEGRYLLKLARKAISEYLERGEVPRPEPGDIPSKRLTEKGACFTTLYEGDKLRGCIGSLERERPLVFDVIDNALNAALRDPRFHPLEKSELKKIRIEISVLTEPEKKEFKSTDELLDFLVPGKHGLIIKKGWARATFLPVVWDTLKTKEDFLSHLCMKAGLHREAWKENGMEYFVYEAQEFTE
jgi:AmmeMemoRadiSam system protein A